MYQKVSNIFAKSNCLTISELTAYSKGHLSVVQQNNVERHLLECEICRDLCDGLLTMQNISELPSIQTDLNNSVKNLISKKQNQTKRMKPLYYLSLAASVVIIFGSLFFLYKIFYNSQDNFFAENFDLSQEKVLSDGALPASDNIETEQPATEENNLLRNEKIDNSENVEQVGGSSDIETVVPSIILDSDLENPIADEILESDIYKKSEIEDDNIAEVNIINESEQHDFEDITLYDNFVSGNAYSESGVVESVSSYSNIEYQQEAISENQRARDVADNKQSLSYMPSIYTYSFHLLDSLATKNYIEQNYVQAIEYYKLILEQMPENKKALYYCGVSYLKINKPEDASKMLEKLCSMNNFDFKTDAQWYLALTYIELNKKRKAIELLHFLIDTNSEYQQRAEDLLKELGNGN